MTTDTPAAAPTAEREALLHKIKLYAEYRWQVGHHAAKRTYDKSDRYVALSDITLREIEDALSAPVAAPPAASGVDALWVETAMELVEAFGQSCRLRGVLQAQGKDTTKANCAIFDDADALRTHLSTALTGAAKEVK